MADKDYQSMTDDELAEERIKLDEQIQALRAEKLKIQRVVDSRIKPVTPKPGDYTIGLG